MIRALVRFGKWLEARFPEKVVVTLRDYTVLADLVADSGTELDLLRSELRELKANHEATIDRVGRVEASAVHKGAVQDLVAVVKVLQTELVALKANLGWSKPVLEDADKAREVQAMLNGEVL
jgi:hypothetical protein